MMMGGRSKEAVLASLGRMNAQAAPITGAEYRDRIARVAALMAERGIAALYLNAGSNLTYFTGMRWSPSERMVGAVLSARGALTYIAPAFEQGTIQKFMVVESEIRCWEEHESAAALLFALLGEHGIGAGNGRVAIDENCPLLLFDALREASLSCPGCELVSARPLTLACRSRKSAAELALMQCAMDMTLAVQEAASRILHEGITTTEVEEFIALAHKRVGASGSYFCIVLFGEATSYPHGVNYVQTLQPGDMVLIDTGCKVHNYISDITRTYVFGEPSARQRQVWMAEKEAQAAAFAAARLGLPCEDVDAAARRSLEADGFGPGYKLPGLPHRTGHGIGLDIHEGPYLVGGERTPLDVGMCFSNEPMICVPGEFGIRLEDHFYMTEDGPRWFTEPAGSIDAPFGR